MSNITTALKIGIANAQNDRGIEQVAFFFSPWHSDLMRCN